MKLLGLWGRNTPSVVFLHCGNQSWTHPRGWRSWFGDLRTFFFWMRRNFSSDTSLIRRDVRRASRWRRRIRRYRGSWDARRFSLRCQPSMSLLVRTNFMYTLQEDGGHVLPVIQFLPTYCINCWCFWVDAVSWSRAYIAGISFAGRNGRAMTLLMNTYVPRSLLWSAWSPKSSTWKKGPTYTDVS